MKSYKSKTKPLPAAIAASVFVSVVFTLVSAMLLAYMIYNHQIGEGTIQTGAGIIIVLGAFTGALIVRKGVNEGKLPAVMLHCAGYLLALFLVSLLFGEGHSGIGKNVLLILLGGGMSLIPRGIAGKSGAKRYMKTSFR